MRILFDSKKTEYKSPFGCLLPEQDCTLRIRIPCTVETSAVTVCVQWENGALYREFPLAFACTDGPYDLWQGTFSLAQPGLFFYFFRITGHTGTFRLFKYGDDTNMEDGSLWQVSCIPADFTTPDWAKGAIIYQVFPDRFCKVGNCNLTGKLQPYTVHKDWNEEVDWRPDGEGRILNNDFYGGNFRGIAEKLDYIAALGATILYLNPICKSFSSHRYDTGNYKSPDPMLGTEEDFRALCDCAHARGIRVILDGVFSHTGADSLYFDKYGHFGGKGAYSDPKSPYFSWYRFHNYPEKYDSWWGFDTLPTVNKLDPGFLEYIITGEDSVIAHWLALGADGFRLDVADELPDAFILALKRQLRKLKPDALLMGEVWEDASHKIAHGVRRRYFVDGELDSVMNYPFRTAVLCYLRGEDDGRGLRETVLSVAENYPPQVLACNMNLLGTHDTPRIRTALVDDFDGPREALAERRLSDAQRVESIKRLRLATFLQYTLPGSPSIYYGDEVGMEGGKDPFNRRTFPWGQEDHALQDHYRMLAQLRKKHPVFRDGGVEFFHAEGGRIGFRRTGASGCVNVYVNRLDTPWQLPGGVVEPMDWRVEDGAVL